MKTKSMKEYLSKELIWDIGIASLVRDCEEEILVAKIEKRDQMVKVKHMLCSKEIKETSRKLPI